MPAFFFRFPTKSDGFSTGSGKCHQNHALTEMLLYFDYISIIFDPQGISHGSRPSALSSLPSRSLPTELSQAISHGFLSVHLCRFRIAPPPRGKVNYKREPKHRRCFWEQDVLIWCSKNKAPVYHDIPIVSPLYLDNSNLKATPRGGKHPNPNHHSSDVELSWYSLTFRAILYHIVPSFLLVNPRFLILKLPLNIATSSFLLVKYGQDSHFYLFHGVPKIISDQTPSFPWHSH